ncbi:MAG: hypothetical protein ACYS1A_13610 [Planctomycetota bacterium]|jgi:hypothetical protein
MVKKLPKADLHNLPVCAADFIKLVIKKMRYRKKVRADVAAELIAHFEDELKECTTDDQRQQKAQQLIGRFGDVKLLGVLLRRAKKRCRPLWRTIVARGFQTAGVLILCLIVYIAWFLTGKPTVDVDYLAVWNQMNRPQLSEKDNAWPHYEKAIRLYIEPNEPIKEIVESIGFRQVDYLRFGDSPEKAKIKEWIEHNEQAWKLYVQASSKPYCYREYGVGAESQDGWLLYVLMPHLKSLKDLSKLGFWQTKFAMEEGNVNKASEDCLALIRTGRHWQKINGTLIEYLVGLAISEKGHEQILKVSANKQLSKASLEDLQQKLLSVYPDEYPNPDLTGERMLFLDTVQRVFTKGGIGGGHLIPKLAIPVIHDYDVDFEEAILIAAGGLVHAGRDETIAKANQIYDKLEEIMRLNPFERHQRDISGDNIISSLPEYRYFFILTFMPALDRISELRFRGRALREATLTVLALLRCKLEKGQFPEKLKELIEAGYLTKLPMDPYSDKSLVYKKTDDNFLLYSFGENLKDDGGRVFQDDKGKAKKWADEGDAVFWPVRN